MQWERICTKEDLKYNIGTETIVEKNGKPSWRVIRIRQRENPYQEEKTFPEEEAMSCCAQEVIMLLGRKEEKIALQG